MQKQELGKLTNTQLNKLKSVAKNKTGTALTIPCKCCLMNYF